jgi:magnesium transporter
MLVLHTCAGGQGITVDNPDTAVLTPDIVWIDMLAATHEEIAFVERETGLKVPSKEDLSEIESSSRLYTENGALYLSAPIIFRATSGFPQATPVGFALNSKRLVSIRFEELTAFTTFTATCAKVEAVHSSSAGALAGLLDACIDRMADVLEQVGSDLDAVSRRIFRSDVVKPGHRIKFTVEDADLRATLRRIGRAGDLASLIRDSLLGVGRLVPYVLHLAGSWLPPEVRPRLEAVRTDVASLNDYESHLTAKVSLLLDATLGLINVEQNNIFKVLTIVSVVGIPPTLIASMYGMNFHDMPELSWSWGYPWGLGLIAVSAIAPIAWFKLRGWI